MYQGRDSQRCRAPPYRFTGPARLTDSTHKRYQDRGPVHKRNDSALRFGEEAGVLSK